jgi:hypothetical protein
LVRAYLPEAKAPTSGCARWRNLSLAREPHG